ncbi:hypothetical protein AA0Z99_10555 [Agrococcus sp. 1P02AA]|uniref:hypothetical protein n=1 Tax=Agrococcus sp. 1P02AA TaxID=3132259 RepID=UPI0039A58A05
MRWASIVSLAIGALTYLALAFWWSSPVGAALPTFAIAFLLYRVWARAAKVGGDEAVESRHLAEVEGAEADAS